MNFRLILTLATLGCATLVSCYPYNERDRRRDPRHRQQKSITSQEQQKIAAQREAKQKQAQAQATRDREVKIKQDDTTGTTPPPERETPKPPVEEKKEYVFAQKVPGKDGFVFSPYNNQVVDVRDIPSGTLVRDPTYSGTGKGYFRVP